MIRTFVLALLLNVVCLVTAVPAHYLWVAVTAKAGSPDTANIYFEESPNRGTGEYLEPIMRTGKTWIRTVAQPQPQLLDVTDITESNARWLFAELPQAAPRSIDCYAKFGVYRYGQTDVLLHYYARFLDVDAHEDLHELARAEQLRLDIVPHEEEDHVELKVLWEGKVVGGRMVHIRGPQGFVRNLKTDDNGRVHFKPEAAGRYTFRTHVELNEPGQEGEKSYALIRHHATLVMNLPLKK